MHLLSLTVCLLGCLRFTDAFSPPQKRPLRVLDEEIDKIPRRRRRRPHPFLTLQQDTDDDAFVKKEPGLKPSDETSDEEEVYRRKLAEAQIAIAEAEEARRRLVVQRKSSSLAPLQAPIITRAKISRSDAGTLRIELPPTGLNAASLFSGAFSIAWFSVVLPATFSGIWLFMLPFWAAGALVAKQAIVDPFVSAQLTIGQYAWSLKSIYGGENGITLNEKEGATKDLRAARPELVAIVNGMPQYEIKLYSTKGVTSLPVGTQISEEELAYIANEINNHLQEVQDMPDVEGLRSLSS